MAAMLLALSSPAAAQDSAAGDPSSSEGATSEPAKEIVVTGSLIARPDYQANSPIVSVGDDVVQNTGQLTVERALTQLPQFAGGLGQSNTATTSTGLSGGQANASLRGLGSKRTLILLEGKRLQPSNPDGSVDLNTIPESVIGNIEVITGGASTTYGSDATAGVVNFRVKRDLSGLTLKGFTGVSNYGDGVNHRLSATGGGEFADGRGRAILALDYSNRERAKRRKRPWYPDRTYETGNAANPYGSALFSGNEPTLAAVNSVFADKYGYAPFVASNGSRLFSGGAQIGFNNDGTLYTANNAPVVNFRGVESDDAFFVDSGNSIFGPSKQFKFNFIGGDIQSQMERYQAFGRVDYDLTDSISAYAQFNYTTYSQRSIVNTTLSNNIYLQNIPYNSYFVPEDLRTILASRADPTADFQFYKAWNAIGNRGQTYDYDVWQFLFGLTGGVGIGDLTWELYGSRSSSKFRNGQTGGLSLSRMEALLASPTGGLGDCQAFNIFGDLPISEACANYVKRDTLNLTDMEQDNVQATIQGGLIDLPAGKVRFAAGAGYRSNSFDFRSDDALNQPGGTSDIIGFAVLRSSAGEVKVNEFFAELLVPVLHDLPLVKELSFDLGYRYSDYNSIGGAHTYKGDFDWQVFDQLRLRGGYNRAIRAPSVGELFAPISTGSSSIGQAAPNVIAGDPCDYRSSYRRGPNEAQVRALCLAQGMSPGTYGTTAAGFIGTSQVFPLTGGNPDLDEETADTWSVGAVISSPFSSPLVNRMSLSVDWYKIKISDAIGVLQVAQSVQYCFNADGASNPTYDQNNYYCQLLARAPEGTLEPPTSQPLLNLGTFQVSGIDAQFDWRVGLDDVGIGVGGDVRLRTIVSYLDSFKVQALPGAPTYDYAGTIGFSIESNAGISHPKWKAYTTLGYSDEHFDMTFIWRFIDKMKHSNSVNSSNAPAGIKTYHAFDLNFEYRFDEDVTMQMGVSNLFNKAPPTYSNVPATYDSSTYDVLGRNFFMSIEKRF
ncbi:TonB-dependent receptor plug domain-containing protein [Novosphingobium album (ex Liu et al. 2023)]|uniref:TonB-dependent receptor n=1 Tax=Novosphingobium album (ex Liu et al. 2023) TaxID=3031130 RepID=A0ABT5WS04_9SPHN|nr:TonB-dependent receptor [Novosphingobium album (ex Liu et al. 2023)]MDE8652032.1 TonB-dependent receptor [Novosphingobium album (ex Liu et al. 2023)]